MDYRALKTNALIALLSQGVAFLLSAITTLVIPKIIGVEQFGYWQLFLFYATYVGFFHFGLNDGVYLLNGGKLRSQLDKKSIASQFVIGLVVQSMIGILVIIFALGIDVEQARIFVITFTAIYLVICNAASFLGFVFQAINETRLYSLSVVVDKLSFLAPLLILIILKTESFEPYIVSWCFAKSISLVFCCYHARDILTAGFYALKLSLSHAIYSSKVGIKLTIANIASLLILGIVRFAIDVRWDIVTFGQVSLAITFVNFYLAMISQVAMVLFPALRLANREEQRSFFQNESELLSLFLPIAYLLYVPMCYLVDIWLPQYQDSLLYFAYLLPLCVYDGKMNMIGITFMKVMRMEGCLLAINCVSVVASAALTIFFVFTLDSMDAALLGAVGVVALRSIVAEIILMRKFKVFGIKSVVSDLLISMGFLAAVVSFENAFKVELVSMILYLIILIIDKNAVIRMLKKTSNRFS